MFLFKKSDVVNEFELVPVEVLRTLVSMSERKWSGERNRNVLFTHKMNQEI